MDLEEDMIEVKVVSMAKPSTLILRIKVFGIFQLNPSTSVRLRKKKNQKKKLLKK